MPESGDLPVHASRDQLRAMAHPLRMQIVERVGRRGTARAADLASDLGVPANSISYHLRILARGGVITEAPEAARDRRDRVWTLRQHSFHHGPGDAPANGAQGEDDDYAAASGAVSLAAIDWMRAAWVAEIADRPGPAAADPTMSDADLPGRGHMFASTLRLSPAQAEEFYERIADMLQEYNRMNRDVRGADLQDDPDSPGGAIDFRVLFALVGDRPGPPHPDGQAPPVESRHDHA
ncbi:MAG: hypothetical protein DI611_09340 [Brachybacterium faecium]|nr:MAG: hypothetical protein DI611_09340 [Brachybacterium faecium]